MVQCLLGPSVLKPEKSTASWDEGYPCLSGRKGSGLWVIWENRGAPRMSGAVPGPRRPSPRAAGSSRPSLGPEDPRSGPRAQGNSCNRSFGIALPARPVDASPEGGQHLRRTCLAAAERTARPGRGAGRGGASERGNSVREGRPGCTQRWAPARAPESLPLPPLRGRRAGRVACRWGLAS